MSRSFEFLKCTQIGFAAVVKFVSQFFLPFLRFKAGKLRLSMVTEFILQKCHSLYLLSSKVSLYLLSSKVSLYLLSGPPQKPLIY